MTPAKTVTITLMQDAHGNVRVCTDLPQPAMGAPLSGNSNRGSRAQNRARSLSPDAP